MGGFLTYQRPESSRVMYTQTRPSRMARAVLSRSSLHSGAAAVAMNFFGLRKPTPAEKRTIATYHEEKVKEQREEGGLEDQQMAEQIILHGFRKPGEQPKVRFSGKKDARGLDSRTKESTLPWYLYSLEERLQKEEFRPTKEAQRSRTTQAMKDNFALEVGDGCWSNRYYQLTVFQGADGKTFYMTDFKGSWVTCIVTNGGLEEVCERLEGRFVRAGPFIVATNWHEHGPLKCRAYSLDMRDEIDRNKWCERWMGPMKKNSK
ncbi:hypothetical protein BJ508DRAFT_360944 [Ascobolus immersus RN42]|uniref:Uncharacterized protein n=1 Tax=Ascobolus immersus RN42 TaxID=1160509 RepID=A0A3N4IB72_ASCIM|nr:hypothetical protein BJ508DRAFT_360944 [Ascobolus immersus RN42]